MANENKVKFGLEGCVFVPETETDVYDNENKVVIPGAVNLTRERQGEDSNFYADDMTYYITSTYQGFTGELEIAMATELMEQKIWGDAIDETTGIMVENRNSKQARGAFGYKIKGDQHDRYFWNYGVTLSRPNTEASTTQDTAEPQTDTMNISVTGLSDGSGVVGIKTSSKTPEQVYKKWFDKVIMPNEYTELMGE